jgi:hypothetical protein
MKLIDFEQEEEFYQVHKTQIEYSELDDVYFEEIEDIDLMDFFDEKNKEINIRECLPTTSSSTVPLERTEEARIQTASSPPSAPPSTEPKQ